MGNNILAYQFVFFLYIFCFELIMYSSFLKVLFAIQCLNILKCESKRSIPLLIKGQFLLKQFSYVFTISEYVTNLIFTKYKDKTLYVLPILMSNAYMPKCYIFSNLLRIC